MLISSINQHLTGKCERQAKLAPLAPQIEDLKKRLNKLRSLLLVNCKKRKKAIHSELIGFQSSLGELERQIIRRISKRKKCKNFESSIEFY